MRETNTLGELYGWANAETAPLYNGCAIAALHHLGYAFHDKDYAAFVAAHEQFKQVYQQQVGHLRPDLPLNLEIDKLYNVIDKVDLKRRYQRTLAKPFSEMFASWEEAEAVFDALPRPHANWASPIRPMNGSPSTCATRKASISCVLATAGGWCWALPVRAERSKKPFWPYLARGRRPAAPSRTVQTRPGRTACFPLLVSGDLLWPFTEEVELVWATLKQVKAKFAHWVRCPYRIHTKDAIIAAVFDPTARTHLLSQGWPPNGTLNLRM